MNLINAPWILVQREDGAITHIAPWQVTEPDNPIVRLAAPRPDFNGALIQFLIGLLQTTATPKNNEEWLIWLLTPPSPETLKAKFDPYADIFELDGDGPRFMQDYEPLEGEQKPISGLVIEAPGNRTSSLFLDHFNKEGLINSICPSCAAAALFCLQTNAPSGGVGHRTSLRGGGPLTTLVIQDTESKEEDEKTTESLWQTLWLNILEPKIAANLSGNSELKGNEHIFPWLAKTGTDTTPEQAHPLQMYWGMPRRIRIDWDNRKEGACDLCHAEKEQLVTHYVTKNYGINYTGSWQHPLSPHYIEKKSGDVLPMHAQPGGLAYRHWLAWTQDSETCKPARVVLEHSEENGHRLKHEQLRLWVFGYDMDNMKARCWYEAAYPLIFIEDEAQRHYFCLRIEKMVTLATQMGGFVQSCLKEAWFSRPGDARGDTAFIKEAFYQQTETVFKTAMQNLQHAVMQNGGQAVVQQWHERLAHEALKLFDYWAAREDITVANPRRIAEAHQKLRNLIYGKKLMSDLGLIKQKRKTA